MKKLITLFLLLVLPGMLSAKTGTHIAIQENQECSECHLVQQKAWFESQHGLMNVKCMVCHGSKEGNFDASKDNKLCLGCHSEQVEQAKKSPSAGVKHCYSCHDHHSLAVKNPPAKPVHSKQGGQ